MLVLMLAMTGACHMYDEGDGDANAEHCETNAKRIVPLARRSLEGEGDDMNARRRGRGGDDAKDRERVPMAQLRHSENVQ